MSTRVTNTGAFFAYVGRGLGIAPGVGSAFVSLVAYLAIQLAIFGFFGAVMAAQMKDTFGIDWAWWVWVLIAWAAVLVLSLLSVDVGAKLLGVLMCLEIGSLLVLAVVVLAKGGPDGTSLSASFSLSAIFSGGFTGGAGIALAFAFASFIGFEATAIYGEESRDPKRTVPRATYLAVGAITVLFALTSFAIVTGLGHTQVVEETVRRSTVDGTPLADPAAVVFSLAEQYVGSWLSTLMSWLVLSSLFAGLLAFQNSAARYFFALGRAGVLPRALDRTNRPGAPHVASALTSLLTLVVIAIFAVRQLDPVTNLFAWFSGLAVVAIGIVEVARLHRGHRLLPADAGGHPALAHADRAGARLRRAPDRPVPAHVPLRPARRHGGGGRRPQPAGLGAQHHRLGARAAAVRRARRRWPSWAPSAARTRTRTPCKDLVS